MDIYPPCYCPFDLTHVDIQESWWKIQSLSPILKFLWSVGLASQVPLPTSCIAVGRTSQWLAALLMHQASARWTGRGPVEWKWKFYCCNSLSCIHALSVLDTASWRKYSQSKYESISWIDSDCSREICSNSRHGEMHFSPKSIEHIFSYHFGKLKKNNLDMIWFDPNDNKIVRLKYFLRLIQTPVSLVFNLKVIQFLCQKIVLKKGLSRLFSLLRSKNVKRKYSFSFNFFCMTRNGCILLSTFHLSQKLTP